MTLPNPAEKAVDQQERAKAMEFLQRLMGAKQGGGSGYTPIAKALKTIGVEAREMAITLGDEPTDCLVIPIKELMEKEWRYMSELDTIKENLGQ